MERSKLESAINELDELLLRQAAPEAHFQAWFERHPVVFDAYGYKRSVPHPRLEHPDGLLIPDFIAQRVDDLWEVVELKRDNTTVVRQTGRENFYSEFEQYYGQCRQYSEFFFQEALRSQFNGRSGLDVQADVRSFVIAGRRESLDFRRVHHLLTDRGAKLVLQTYDDVRSQLEFYRTRLFARDEKRPGLFLWMVWMPERLPDGQNWILDLGTDEARDRFSLYIDDQDGLIVDVHSSDARRYSVRVPLERASILYGTPIIMSVQIGLSRDDTFASIEVNGRHFFDRRLDSFSLDIEFLRHIVLGSDMKGQANSKFSMGTWLYGIGTNTFQQRRETLVTLSEYYAADFGGVGESRQWVQSLGNHAFMKSEGHPNFEA